MTTIHERHLELVDSVNDAKTQNEHDRAEYVLQGFRDGVSYCERYVCLAEADMHSMIRFGEDRPMCCGVLLDWKPAEGGTA